MLKNIIFISILFFTAGTASSLRAEIEYSTEFKFGISYFNSHGLNKITEGLNAGYSTSFGKIRVPLVISGGVTLDFGKWGLGFVSGYEFTKRSSYSELYDFTENLRYSYVPFLVKFQYEFIQRTEWLLLATLETGLFYSRFSMKTEPSVSEDVSYRMKALGWTVLPGVSFVYSVSSAVKVTASLGARYAKTSKFKYIGDTSRHSSGEEVLFADGTNLTLNLSGVKFLVGIIFFWS